jgi:hypothetical protein
MSATIEPFPKPPRPQTRGPGAAIRYVRRAEEAFELLAAAKSEGERRTLCDIAEIWLDMAEAALPSKG